MPKLKTFSIKKNDNWIVLKKQYLPISDKEQFHIIQGLSSFEDFIKLKEILKNYTIGYKYLGVKYGFHNYIIRVKRLTNDKRELTFNYTGLTDHADNPLTLQSILYEIAEIYSSDETNPCWENDKDKQKLMRLMFTDKEIEVFPNEINWNNNQNTAQDIRKGKWGLYQ